MKKIVGSFILLFIILINGSFCFSTKEKKETVQWLTVTELQKAYKINPKPILVDVYTSWCGWCKVMEKETYNRDSVVTFINAHYYALRLDAETKEDILWNGKNYSYNKTYKANDFANYLIFGQMSFPTTVFLADINAQPAPLPGYYKPAEFEGPLKYFGNGNYKTQTYTEFLKTFSSKW